MKTIYVGLSVDEIQKAKKELIAYRDSLRFKCEKFVSRLADEGISVGTARLSGELGSYVTFEKKVSMAKYSARAVIIASSPSVTRSWLTKDGEKSVDISPLLMQEFGAGPHADGLKNSEYASKLGMGRGTFPGQTHADEDEWWWMDTDGNWQKGSGEEATMPVFGAIQKIQSIIVETAREVFSEDD